MWAAGIATWITPQRARLLQRHQAFTLSPAAQVVVVLQLVATKLCLLSYIRLSAQCVRKEATGRGTTLVLGRHRVQLVSLS